MTDRSLTALLGEGVGSFEGAFAIATAGGTDFYLDDILFASVAAGEAEFRLRDEVAAATLRTPDVRPSPRGPGWVRFAPNRIDGHARDRALAWFESAWRRADAEIAGIPVPDWSAAGPGDLDDEDDPEDEPGLHDGAGSDGERSF